MTAAVWRSKVGIRRRVACASLLVLLRVLARRLDLEPAVLQELAFAHLIENGFASQMSRFSRVRAGPVMSRCFCRPGEKTPRTCDFLPKSTKRKSRQSVTAQSPRERQEIDQTQKGGPRETYLTFSATYSRSVWTLRASLAPSAKRARALARRACVFACSAASSRLLLLSVPEL